MVKMALLEGKNLTLGPFNFGSHVSTFQAENTRKNDFLRPRIILKQLLDNSKPTFKTSKKIFFDPENGQNLSK